MYLEHLQLKSQPFAEHTAVDALWQGKTSHGEDVTLYGYEWINPHPDKEVTSIRIVAEDTRTDASLMVAGISIVAPGD